MLEYLLIHAEEKIRQIEEGAEPEFLEVITDRIKAATILAGLAQSVHKEALFLLPNDKALMRMDKLRVLDSLIMASTRGASVKIICPTTDHNSEITKRISEEAPELNIRSWRVGLPYGLFIADNSKYFNAELRDPDAQNFSEAIGFGLYSNSRAGVDSFKSFFELLWNKPLAESPHAEPPCRR
ncbi:MAG: hypothetical protein M3P08_04620 [Thermoproteota archaeon]|nr:hypothetical protein [Thermoproteota archaeon]